MTLLRRLEKSKSFWFLLIASITFFLLRLPSLFEPYWYGDEGIYQALGMLIRAGHPLYSGAWDNKPPLLYVIYAIFASEQFWTRLASLVVGLLSVWVFYFLAKKLFLVRRVPEILTLVYVFLFGIRLLEGNIANAENFMLFPIVLSAFFVYSMPSLKKEWHSGLYFFSGFLIGVAFLLKIVAVFDFLAFFSFIFITSNLNSLKKLREVIFRHLLPFTLGFAIPILISFGYYFLTNNFKDFFSALLFSNVGYVGYGNKLIIPQGFLILKSALLGLFILILFIKRKSLPKSIVFVLVWLAFSVFNALFSQRPYTHYLLVLLPSFCLLLGIVFSKKRSAALGVITLAIVLIFVVNNFNLRGRLLDYYVNFLSFNLGSKTLAQYQSFFDGNTPRDYELARYIKNHTNQNETVLIWGNDAQVYKLSGKIPIFRYVVAYHITNFKGAILEMEDAVRTKKPELIILMPNVGQYPLNLDNYGEKMEIQHAKIYERQL